LTENDQSEEIISTRDAATTSGRMQPFENPIGGLVRFTMVKDLIEPPADLPMPFGYRVEPWTDPMLPAYAAAMAVAFSDSPELEVYPKLGSREGCVSIVKDISAMPDFLAGASLLAFFNREPCAFILTGFSKGAAEGRIHVLGVGPRHRGIHIGTQLVNMALWAFRDRRFVRAVVRVNRLNRGGIRFFRTLGFHVSSSQEYL